MIIEFIESEPLIFQPLDFIFQNVARHLMFLAQVPVNLLLRPIQPVWIIVTMDAWLEVCADPAKPRILWGELSPMMQHVETVMSDDHVFPEVVKTCFHWIASDSWFRMSRASSKLLLRR